MIFIYPGITQSKPAHTLPKLSSFTFQLAVNTSKMFSNSSPSSNPNSLQPWQLSEHDNSSTLTQLWPKPEDKIREAMLLPHPRIVMQAKLLHAARDHAVRLGVVNAHELQQSGADMPNESNVTQEIGGMLTLIDMGNYRAAANVSTNILTSADIISSEPVYLRQNWPELMHVWSLRLSCLILSREISIAESEMNTFGDLEDSEYYEKTSGSVMSLARCRIPWSIRLIHANIPFYKGDLEQFKESRRRLSVLKIKLEAMLKDLKKCGAEISAELVGNLSKIARTRLDQVLGCLYVIAYEKYDLDTLISAMKEMASTSRKDIILRKIALGRFLIKSGDIAAADSCFRQLEQTLSEQEMAEFRCEICFNRCYLCIAEDNYNNAAFYIQEALKIDGNRPELVLALSVVQFYAGDTQNAIATLENSVYSNPKAISETACFNLVMLYELGGVSVWEKKSRLLRHVALNYVDSFNVGCLRMFTNEGTV